MAVAVRPAGTVGGIMSAWTVKLTPLLAAPPTVTTTLPVVAPLGTVAVMLAAPQLAAVVAVPLKVTVLAPCVAPKFVPTIVTEVPTGPDVGFRLVILGTVVAVENVMSGLEALELLVSVDRARK